VTTVTKFRVLKNAGIFLTSWDTSIFWRGTMPQVDINSYNLSNLNRVCVCVSVNDMNHYFCVPKYMHKFRPLTQYTETIWLLMYGSALWADKRRTIIWRKLLAVSQHRGCQNSDRGSLEENLHTWCKCSTACVNYQRHETQFAKAIEGVPFASQNLGVVRSDDDWYVLREKLKDCLVLLPTYKCI
jgi:hypothetical protein